jgi:hypothetical protein
MNDGSDLHDAECASKVDVLHLIFPLVALFQGHVLNLLVVKPRPNSPECRRQHDQYYLKPH